MLKLTRREQQVCNLLVRGWTTKEISASFGHRSHRSVDDHRAAVFLKFKVRNAVELVRAIYGLDQLDLAKGNGSPERPFSLTDPVSVVA